MCGKDMYRKSDKYCPKCGSDNIVITEIGKHFKSCNNCNYKVNFVVTPEDKWRGTTTKTKPVCAFCGNSGKMLVECSEEGIKYAPCICGQKDKTRYSIGDGLHTEEENRQTLLKAIIKYSKPKKYPVSEMEEFYDHMSSFIRYPTMDLNELADIFENGEENINEIKRLIGILHMDNCALYSAIHDGIHPITGCKWQNNDNDWKRYEYLKNRNNKMITHLENMLKIIDRPRR
jgi:hypothetical protein